MIKLYNTKSNKIEELIPNQPGHITMYVCGPTVYDHPHIGNARPIVVFDTLKKFLEANNYKVHYVSNYTDIDDRIIERAHQEQVSEKVISTRYIKAYEEVRESIHADVPDDVVLVTETMDEIIAYIENLIHHESAYEVDGDVFFAVNTIDGYGHISGQNIEELRVGARIEENSKKRNPLDFVLWKKTDDGIAWPSPWSMGRPGWHTECVVMIHDKFKRSNIDIHGGGQDLKFPHHENENAQNCASHNHDLANYWVHNAMLDFGNEKMSKSLGNVMWAKDVIEQLGSNVARWLLIQNHYRQNISITDEVIAQSQSEISRIETALKQALLELKLNNVSLNEVDDESFTAFLDSLGDDLNTPNAIKVLFDTVKTLNQALRQRDIDYMMVSTISQSILKMTYILGVEFTLEFSDEAIQKVRDWREAKSNKDFETADRLRGELIEEGIL